MSEQSYNNAAGRLLGILKTAHQKGADNKQTHIIWRKTLNLIPIDAHLDDVITVAIYRSLADLSDTLRETEEAIRATRSTDADLYVRLFPQLQKALSPPNLTLSFSEYRQFITADALYGLEFCANSLPKEGEVEQKDIDEISKQVQELFDLVRESDLPKHYRDWLLEILSTIKRSIDLYWIKGARQFRKALVLLIGELAVLPQETKAVKANSQLWDKIKGVIVKLAWLSNKAKQCQPLLEYTEEAVQMVIEHLPELPT